MARTARGAAWRRGARLRGRYRYVYAYRARARSGNGGRHRSQPGEGALPAAYFRERDRRGPRDRRHQRVWNKETTLKLYDDSGSVVDRRGKSVDIQLTTIDKLVAELKLPGWISSRWTLKARRSRRSPAPATPSSSSGRGCRSLPNICSTTRWRFRAPSRDVARLQAGLRAVRVGGRAHPAADGLPVLTRAAPHVLECFASNETRSWAPGGAGRKLQPSNGCGARAARRRLRRAGLRDGR